MKTFIAASLAAVAFTADISDEIDREIQKDCEKFEDWERQAEREGSYEADKEVANFYRELSCWWAGVEPVVDQFSCPDWADVQRDVCTSHGRVWADDWYSCFEQDSQDFGYYQCSTQEGGISPTGGDCWDYWYGGADEKKVMSLRQKTARLAKMLKKRVMMKYQVTVSEAELSAIAKPVEESHAAGEALWQETVGAIAPVVESFVPRWDEQIKNDERVEAQAGEDFMNYLVNNVYLDGESLASLVGTPDQWILKKKAMNKRKNMSKKIMQEGQSWELEWEFPSPDEINAWIETTAGPAVDRIAKGAEELEQLEREIRRDAERDFEDRAGPTVEAMGKEAETLVNEVASEVKKAMLGADYQAVMLAEKHTAAQHSSSVQTGLAAGVVGALAGCAVFAIANRQKSVSNSEQPFL